YSEYGRIRVNPEEPMKAIVCTKYGSPSDVLLLKEVAKPTPTDNQVLVNVHAASVNKKDLAPVRGAFVARLHPLRETAEAIRYLEEGQVGGKVIITWKSNNM